MIPQHHLPADIERTSMQIIAKELEERHIRIPRENLAVVKRVIHTTADFEYAETLHFTENAVQKAIEALHNGAVQILPDEDAVGKRHIAVPAPGLRDGNGAGIHADIIRMLRAFGDVRVAVQENVAGTERRQRVLIVVVAVGGINGPAAFGYDGIIGENGKFQHHLIHFRVTVSPYTENPVLPGI